MGTGEFIKRAWPKLIEATGDPMAPIKLQDAHSRVEAMGHMLAGSADQAVVDEFADKLLQAWLGEEIEQVCYKPEFVIALAGCLTQAIVEYTKYIANRG